MGVTILFVAALAALGPADTSAEEMHALGNALAKSLCVPSAATKSEAFRPSPYDATARERILTVRCRAGESQTLFSPLASRPDGIVLCVKVRGRARDMPAFLQVGAPINQALVRLGPPDSADPGLATYFLDEGGSTLEVSHKNGKIVSLVWSYYSG